MSALLQTNFSFSGQEDLYQGKVRDVYTLKNDKLLIIATDRLSAFDVVLPKGIPYKGQILNQIATAMLKQTEDIVPHWLEATPDPNVAVGKKCKPFKVEMVIRGYLAGHAAREYKAGKRELCGVILPEGLKENDKFPKPIITPSTKADQGDHDEDISCEEIIAQNLVSAEDYKKLETYTYQLFERGTQIAAKQNLILVDTKYEFGKTKDGEIVLIDEIHTPDSSRFFYAEGYKERQKKEEPQKQLSKEFVRQWLISKGFQGKPGQKLPELDDDYIELVSNRYIELYENITGKGFEKADTQNIKSRIEQNVETYLNKLT